MDVVTLLVYFVLSGVVFLLSPLASTPGTCFAAVAIWIALGTSYRACFARGATWHRYIVASMGMNSILPLLWSHGPFQPVIGTDYCAPLRTPQWVCLSSDLFWLTVICAVCGLCVRSRRQDAALFLATGIAGGLLCAVAAGLAGAATGLFCM